MAGLLAAGDAAGEGLCLQVGRCRLMAGHFNQVGLHYGSHSSSRLKLSDSRVPEAQFLDAQGPGGLPSAIEGLLDAQTELPAPTGPLVPAQVLGIQTRISSAERPHLIHPQHFFGVPSTCTRDSRDSWAHVFGDPPISCQHGAQGLLGLNLNGKFTRDQSW